MCEDDLTRPLMKISQIAQPSMFERDALHVGERAPDGNRLEGVKLDLVRDDLVEQGRECV